MARERWLKPRSPSHFCKVGVGGLEPPTSASQTRRAGRLRYTPADKSIIRSMLKGQDLQLTTFIGQKTRLLAIVLLVLISACQPAQTPVPSAILAPSNTATIATPTPTETPPSTPRSSPTPQSSATVTPTKTEDCRAQGGELRSSTIPSEHLAGDLEFSLYLPPCYQVEPKSDYPVIYLLHGLTYTNDQWPRLGLVETMDSLIAQGEIPPIIIVLPREKTFNSPQTSSFPDALIQELLPWIDQNYRTIADASHRGIGGISRGAAWAVRIGFTHPDSFSRIGAHSLPVFAQDTNQVQVWASQTPPQDLPVTLIDIGRNDREVQSALDFANQLDRFNLPHEFYLFNGEHTEAYWAGHLEFYLRWYTQDW